MMKVILFIIALCACLKLEAQSLQKHNYLMMSEEDSLIKVISTPDKGIFFNLPCNCTNSGSLSFSYSPKLQRLGYTPLQEMKKMPAAWNKINLNTLIEAVKKTGEIRSSENRIYFVEKDKCRNVYQIYQVWWINTNTGELETEYN